MRGKLGSEAKILQYWNAAAPHLQAHYCHGTLGTQIKVERIGNFAYFNKKIVATRQGLDTVRSHARQVIGSADLVVYMANDEASLWGTVGIAWNPVICASSAANDQKTSINEWRPQSVSFAGVIIQFLKSYFYIILKPEKTITFGSSWLMKLVIILECVMILTMHMEVNPVLVIKTTISCLMETLRINGHHAAKLIFKHITCKSKINGAWEVSGCNLLFRSINT